jgi:xanthine dehydrogenase YagR molybdenum-binding subunit
MAAPLQDAPPRPPAAGKKWIQVPVVVNGMDTLEWREVDDVAGPQWPPRGTTRVINTDVQRVDGPDKVSGRARYAADVRLPGMAFARLLLCPHPHAKVQLDLEPAKAIEGVLHVRALVEQGAETRFLGQAVAAVAARTPEIAEDGIRAIAAQYEVLPFAVTREQARAEGAPQVTRRGNLGEEQRRGEEEEVELALDGADAKVEATYSLPIQHHVCLEPHGVVVDYRGGDEATIYATTQSTFAPLEEAQGALKLGSGKVVVQVPFMGGGFGSKFGLDTEGRTACEIARELKSPVHLLLTREDEFLMAGNRSGAVQTLRGGMAKDGRLVALHAVVERLGGLGRGSHAGQPYIYQVEKSFLSARSVHTHMDGNRAFRAPGHPQASFAIEGLIDELAYEAGVDLLTARKVNLPERDRAVYERQLDRAAAEIGWAEHPHKTRWDASDAPLKTGIGFGLSTWGGGGGPECVVEVRVDRTGAVSALCGTQDLGTGSRTLMVAIVAEEFGLEPSAVTAQIGDSRLGMANGSGGSTTTASLAPAVKDAAFKARAAFLEAAAKAMGTAPDKLALAGGEVIDSAASKKLPWRDACALLGPNGVTARGEWVSGLSASGVHGAQAAKVSVDTLTGEIRVLKMVAVHDCGLAINRMAVRSQIQGGMVMALSYGLFEERVIDPALGLMLNANLGDYKLAGAREIPEMVAILDDEDGRNAVIGIGEPPIIPGHGAIANAIHNACGVRLREMPLTCDKLLMGLEALRARRKG